jgi:uncharacterized protein YaaN involved in tellurite resistance
MGILKLVTLLSPLLSDQKLAADLLRDIKAIFDHMKSADERLERIERKLERIERQLERDNACLRNTR